MKLERSRTGVFRIPLAFGWAVGFCFKPSRFFEIRKHKPRGWSVNIAWFYIGRHPIRRMWSHWNPD